MNNSCQATTGRHFCFRFWLIYPMNERENKKEFVPFKWNWTHDFILFFSIAPHQTRPVHMHKLFQFAYTFSYASDAHQQHQQLIVIAFYQLVVVMMMILIIVRAYLFIFFISFIH